MAQGRLQPTEIGYYEGLVRKTAALYAPRVQEDYEDIVAILRIKVWRALEAYDPSRSPLTVQRYVFGCLTNQAKDLMKRKRRQEVYLADVSAVVVDVSVERDEVYAEVEDEPPLIPSTLTRLERDVLLRLYTERSQREVAATLGLSRSEMERTMKAIRVKMADWRPYELKRVAIAA